MTNMYAVLHVTSPTVCNIKMIGFTNPLVQKEMILDLYVVDRGLVLC